MKTNHRLWVAAAFLALGGALTFSAQAQTLDFGSCVRIEDLSARLACYDRAAGRAPSAAPAAPASIVPPPSAIPAIPAPAARAPAPVPPPTLVAPTPAMPRDPVASFGAEKVTDDLTAAKVQKKKVEVDDVKQISARITDVHTRPEGQQTFTLENGQVWTQNEVQREPQLAVGDVVIIRRGLLGSFLLTLQKGSATSRVRRIS